MQKRSPLVEGEFLEIHRSKLELDPCGDRGQPSIWSITHCVFLFGVRKDALNRLRTQGVGCFAERGMADIFRSLQILLPDMTGYCFRMLPVLRTFLQFWAISANIAFALVFPISFAVGSGITQNLVLRTQDTIVIFIVHVCIPGQVPFLGHWSFVGKRWDPSTIQDLFANPWRFVPCIRCNNLYFRIMCLQALKYRIECYAVMNVTRRNFRLQYIAPSVAYRMRLVRKAFLVLSLVEHSAFRVGGRFSHHFLLPRCRRPVIVVILLYALSSERGEGYFWYYFYEDMFVIEKQDFFFYDEFFLESPEPDFISVQYFFSVSGEEFHPYRQLSPNSLRVYVGGNGKTFQAVYHKNIPIRSISISIMPDFYNNYLKEKLGGEYIDPRNAFKGLSLGVDFPQLVALLKQIQSYSGITT